MLQFITIHRVAPYAPSRTRAHVYPDAISEKEEYEGFIEGHTAPHVVESQVRFPVLGCDIFCCEFTSAILSVISFVTAFLFITVFDNGNPEFPLWSSNVAFTAVNDIKANTYLDAWTELCPAVHDKAVNVTLKFSDTYAGMITGTESWEVGFFPTWMLLWIFVVSMAFQFGRSWRHTWLNTVFGYSPSDGVEITRWLEYALTSPFQIWIVASLFLVGDILTLLYVAAAQLGLITLGIAIEFFVHTANKKSYKLAESYSMSQTESTSKRAKLNHCQNSAYVLLLLAWAIHAMLWIPLLLRLHNQSETIESCSQDNKSLIERWNESKTLVFVVSYTQFFLFTVFGFILTLRVFQPKASNREDYYRSRVRDSLYYAALSVLAKTQLEFGFLAILWMRMA